MQGIESTTNRWAVRVALVLSFVLLASAVSAATFSVATSRSNLTWQTGETQILPVLGNLPTIPTYGVYPITSLRWRPQGYPTIMGTGSNPVSLTIGPGLIDQAAYPAILPVPTLTSYVQFTTALSAFAPGPGSTANFRPGPKASRPANFNWCPGATANPACTTFLSGPPSQGDIGGLVRYTPGANQFGGTMNVFNTGLFAWYTVEAFVPTYRVRLNNGDPVSGNIAAGGGYSRYVISTAGAGDPIFASPPMVPTPTYGVNMIITDPGTPTTIAPGNTSSGWGFPFTTGTVYIKVPFTPSNPTVTITGMGYDNRTAMGTGNISMVAGGMLTSPQTGITIPQIVTFTLNVPEPNRVVALASGVGLIGLVAAVRRRTSGPAA